MKAVVTDPKVMSVLEKRKGQKGYRELQGDVLRELLTALISTQVSSGKTCVATEILEENLFKDSTFVTDSF